ncbi:hypothetical protein GCM10007111_42630 [Virgibacillus kapii]|uniref:Uncharacterized protein n=1 Tax=Virgibacillus kapii TaxID=1638645 RepID=A0ABQ2DYS9_9BACI|nr:hypothetical protein GCM10007111_42630 [Virgibacillus kapii]
MQDCTWLFVSGSSQWNSFVLKPIADLSQKGAVVKPGVDKNLITAYNKNKCSLRWSYE